MRAPLVIGVGLAMIVAGTATLQYLTPKSISVAEFYDAQVKLLEERVKETYPILNDKLKDFEGNHRMQASILELMGETDNKHYDEAIAILEANMDPSFDDYYSVLYDLGKLYAKTGQTELAIQTYECISGNDQNSDNVEKKETRDNMFSRPYRDSIFNHAQIKLAEIYLKQRNYNRVIDQMDKVTPNSPSRVIADNIINHLLQYTEKANIV